MELATVSVGIPSRPGMKLERSLIDQVDEPVGGLVATRQFRRAFRLADLRCVDIGDADFFSVKPECIAIDDTCDPLGRAAFLDGGLEFDPGGRCGSIRRGSNRREDVRDRQDGDGEYAGARRLGSA